MRIPTSAGAGSSSTSDCCAPISCARPEAGNIHLEVERASVLINEGRIDPPAAERLNASIEADEGQLP